jgi:hypothetical protein
VGRHLVTCGEHPPFDFNDPAQAKAHSDIHDGFTLTDVPVSLGMRTVADLRHGPPPQPAIPPFFTTEEALVLYGPGGVGKGTVTAYVIAMWLRLFTADVYILDFEGHEEEWANRLRGLGVKEAGLRRVHYREPFGADWEADRGTLRQSAELVRDELERLAIGLVVVDSIVMASDGDAAMGGAQAAKDYFAALATMGRRSLSIAHVAAGAEKWPDKPFGSSYVHNLARETWAIERTSDDDMPEDPTVAVLSTTIRVELRNKKNSAGARQRPVSFDITHFANGELQVHEVKDAKQPRDRVRDVLRGTQGMQVKAIVAAVNEDAGETVVTAKQVTNALRKNPAWFDADKAQRPHLWVVK